jgi:hypothetical protein
MQGGTESFRQKRQRNFIVTTISHWTKPPAATLPQQRTTPATTITRNATTNQLVQPQGTSTTKHVIKCHLPTAQSHRRKRPLSNRKEQRKRTSPTRKDSELKASQMSNKKWHNQSRQFILNWTPQQWTRTWPFQRSRWNGMSNLDNHTFNSFLGCLAVVVCVVDRESYGSG